MIKFSPGCECCSDACDTPTLSRTSSRSVGGTIEFLQYGFLRFTDCYSVPDATVTLSGGTGGFAGANGTYTLTPHTSFDTPCGSDGNTFIRWDYNDGTLSLSLFIDSGNASTGGIELDGFYGAAFTYDDISCGFTNGGTLTKTAGGATAPSATLSF